MVRIRSSAACILVALAGCNAPRMHAPAIEQPAPAVGGAGAVAVEAVGGASGAASEPDTGAAGGGGAGEGGAAGASPPANEAGKVSAGAPAVAAGAPAMAAGMAAPAIDARIPPEVRAHAADWPLPNLDYDNTRNSKTRIDASTIAKLKESWRFEVTGSAAFGYMTANPIVLGDRVYIQDMQSNVYALERASGKLLWKRVFGRATVGPNGVAVGWGKLFAIAGDSDVVALSLDDGADVWKFTPMFNQSEGMDIQPLAYGGTLFASTVPASVTRGFYEGGARGKLLALDAESGKQRWSFDTISSVGISEDPEAYGGGGAWYPPLIDAARGLTYWGTGNPVPWPGTPGQFRAGTRAGSPNLYTSSLVAVGLEDGAYRFHHQDQPHDIFDWDFQGTPLLARAEDLVLGSGKTGAVVALDPDTGKLVWRTKVGKHMNDELTEYPQQSITIYPGVLGGVMSALAYADGVVYVPSVDLPLNFDGTLLIPEVAGGTGTISALDVRDGRVLWTAPTSGACYGAATLANDLVLTSDEKGRVYAFARDTGKEVWHYDAPGGINAPLVVTGDTLLIPVGVNMGMLVALSL